MAKKTRSGVYRCSGGFAAPIGGQVVTVPSGALVPYEFPYEVMDGREALFDDITVPRPPVEPLLAAEPAVSVDELPPRSGPGSGRDAWADYAAAHGVEVTDDMTRDDIAEALT